MKLHKEWMILIETHNRNPIGGGNTHQIGCCHGFNETAIYSTCISRMSAPHASC